MSAKSRLPSTAIFALLAGGSRERARQQMALAIRAKCEGRSPSIFVACARIHWHAYIHDMRMAAASAEVLTIGRNQGQLGMRAKAREYANRFIKEIGIDQAVIDIHAEAIEAGEESYREVWVLDYSAERGST